MSDRCFVQIQILRKDLPLLENLVAPFDEVIHEDERCVVGYFHDAPGAYAARLTTLAKKGAIFEGYHESCIGAWDPHAVVGVNGEYPEILCAPMCNGSPVVIVEEDGQVSPASLADALAFCEARRSARRILEGQALPR